MKEKQETLQTVLLKKCYLKVDHKNLLIQKSHRGLMLVPFSLDPGLQILLNLKLLVLFFGEWTQIPLVLEPPTKLLSSQNS